MNKKVIFLIFFISLLILFFVSKFFVSKSDPELFFKNILSQADVNINGDRPWDIKVHNKDLYARVINHGSLGLGEAYMDGWWDCDALDQFFFKILHTELDEKINFNWDLFLTFIKAKIYNLQSKNRAFEVGEKHYDLSNELFKNMLDDLMIYSCGYWKNAQNINKAQEDKLDLICKKLYLKRGMKLLDIGCGWGGLAYYAAKNYGVEVTGVTISKEQAKYAQDFCTEFPVKICIQDYRSLKEKFDRVVSVGMFEHVGCKNYREFMKIVYSCLNDNGLFLLHTIGTNKSTFCGDPWLDKYIFPNSMLPSMEQIVKASNGFFIMEDWHNFGPYYDRTLMAWYEKFNLNWPKIKDNYDDRFYRMWKYYLLSCAGLFRARRIQLWQIVFSKKDSNIAEYISVR